MLTATARSLTRFNATHLGADYAPDEVEFMTAMDEYKRLNRRPFPTWREVLYVLKRLGYKKTQNKAREAD
jgi:hypothetical protein